MYGSGLVRDYKLSVRMDDLIVAVEEQKTLALLFANENTDMLRPAISKSSAERT